VQFSNEEQQKECERVHAELAQKPDFPVAVRCWSPRSLRTYLNGIPLRTNSMVTGIALSFQTGMEKVNFSSLLFALFPVMFFFFLSPFFFFDMYLPSFPFFSFS
jgi:hypothetical protein